MFTDDRLRILKNIELKQTAQLQISHTEMEALIARLEASEEALDSYDKFYHGYDDESLDQYRRWLKSKGEAKA